MATTKFDTKLMTEYREGVMADLINSHLNYTNGLELMGRGVDGLVLTDAEGRTVVVKVIAKKEVGIAEELIAEYEAKEAARVAREAEKLAKKERNIEKKKRDAARLAEAEQAEA